MYFLCQNRTTGEIVIAYGKDGCDVRRKFEIHMPDPYLVGGALKKEVIKNLDYPVFFEEN